MRISDLLNFYWLNPSIISHPSVDKWEAEWISGVSEIVTASYAYDLCENSPSLLRDSSAWKLVSDAETLLEESENISSSTPVEEGFKFYFALNLYNSEKLIPTLGINMWRTIHQLALDPSKDVFVSIYEDGSTDHTPELLQLLSDNLSSAGILNNVTTQPRLQHAELNKILRLAIARNQAMETLYQSRVGTFDYVIWLNDVYFCPEDILKLFSEAVLNQAHITCPMDIWIPGLDGVKKRLAHGRLQETKIPAYYYDRWVARLISGYPFAQNLETLETPDRSSFQVLSCWGGGPIIHASLFYHGLRFREGVMNSTSDCAASECQEICHDAWAIGKGRIITVPAVKYAYDSNEFELIRRRESALLKEKSEPRNDTVVKFQNLPKKYNCLSIMPSPRRSGHKFDHPGRMVDVIAPINYDILHDNLPQNWRRAVSLLNMRRRF